MTALGLIASCLVRSDLLMPANEAGLTRRPISSSPNSYRPRSCQCQRLLSDAFDEKEQTLLVAGVLVATATTQKILPGVPSP